MKVREGAIATRLLAFGCKLAFFFPLCLPKNSIPTIQDFRDSTMSKVGASDIEKGRKREKVKQKRKRGKESAL